MALENKLGISDPVELAHREERLSKAAALSLYRDGVLGALEPGAFATLSTIHQRLFGERIEKGSSLCARALKGLAAMGILEWHGSSTHDPSQYYTLAR